jgi:hypothetical protein
MISNLIKGAAKSKMIWWNVFLAVLASLEMMASHLTTLFGHQVAAAVLLLGSLANIVLRTLTTEALAEKK